jgi:dethiobiotin synthetase
LKQKPIFITGIGTGIGKTITSAVLVEKLQADYWKPIQSGDLDYSDTDKVRELVSNKRSVFHPEAYRLTQPFSPHKSAKLDNIRISLESIQIPVTDNRLIIEGAGGLLVPLNDQDLMIDLIQKFDAEVILVSQNYLGSINHTLMSVEILKSRGLNISKLVINGIENSSTEEIIVMHTNLEVIHIPDFNYLTQKAISEFTGTLTI